MTAPGSNEVRPRFPNFVVIGAAKAGTTFLASALAQHTDVHVHPHKEPHFFASEQFNAPGAWERYLTSYDYSGTESACGEASTTNTMNYLYPDAAERIATRLPAARIIYVVRHPLDRILSHWMDLAASSPRPPQVRGLARTVQEWPHLVDVSRYWTQLQQYRAHFEDTSILLLFFEDLVADPGASLRRVFEFLNVDPSFQPRFTGAEKNRSLGRMTDRRWNIWSASHVYRWVRERTPARLRALVRPIIKTRHSRRPEWSSELRQHVIDRLNGEIDSILRYGGKPRDYWYLAR